MAVFAECRPDRLEISPRQHRGTEVAVALRKDRVEIIQVVLDAGLELVLDTFPDHRPLLAGNHQHALVRRRGNRLPERHIVRLGQPFLLDWLAIAEFNKIYAEFVADRAGAGFQLMRDGRIGGDNAAIRQERQRGQQVAEQATANMHEREDATDLPV